MTLYFPFAPILFKKGSEGEKIIEKEIREMDTVDEPARIRCPLCRWQPAENDKWFCGSAGPPENFWSGCGTSWNTFKTGGKCPGCAHQWRWTSCLRCTRWSPHKDWYERD